MSLPRKKKICNECGLEKYLFSKGRCETCTKIMSAKQKRKKRRRVSTTTISSLKKRARYWFQRWIRYRDLGQKCICDSCQVILSDIKVFDAGHYHKAELYSNVVFDEDNVHGCCKACNGFRDGNIIEYRKGLIKKFGEDKLNELENKALYDREPFKWDREFLTETIEKYKQLVKEIESNES